MRLFKTRQKIYRAIPFAIICFIFSIIYVVLEKGLLGNLQFYPSTDNPYNFAKHLYIIPLFGILGGFCMGLIETSYSPKLFIYNSLIAKILIKTFLYLFTIIILLSVTTILANLVTITDATPAVRAWFNFISFLSDYSFWSTTAFAGTIILVCQFYAEVSKNIGYEVLTNFLLGRYYKPTEEERIFMFLDMKSSTTIA